MGKKESNPPQLPELIEEISELFDDTVYATDSGWDDNSFKVEGKELFLGRLLGLLQDYTSNST